MQPRTALAFAPAVISNFFAIHDEALSRRPPDLSLVGATGGGFTLSKGAYSRATLLPGLEDGRIVVRVNDDPEYRATTTKRALEMLVDSYSAKFSTLQLDQVVEVPIGFGFGASAASALSAVLAAASALRIDADLDRISFFAHAADITCKTGLGTVSAICRNVGAGVITEPGGPGVARILHIDSSPTLRVVTASISPLRKSGLLSSKDLRLKSDKLGLDALKTVLREPTMEMLIHAGERFSSGLGLQTQAVDRLIQVALANGAIGASQNMLGEAVHAVVEEEMSSAVADALSSDPLKPTVDTFQIGTRPTSVIGSEVTGYPRNTSSLV